MKIAFLGLGAMGYPMAANLARSHAVTVWNRTADVARRHADEHGTTLAERLDQCAPADVVISIVPTSAEVAELASALTGAGLRPGSFWIDMTSGDPFTSRTIAAALEAKGVRFVDAPVTGGTPGAQAGTLTIMIGGAPEDFERAREICASMGTRIVHVGEIGAGHAVKAVNNAMLAANMWVAAEGLLSLQTLGLNLEKALEVINSGSGRSNASENLLPSRIIGGDWPLTFKLALLDKDVRIAASIAHSQHLATPMIGLTSTLFTAALQALGKGADYIEVAKFVTSLNGESWPGEKNS
ncbi:MAG: NAD(P)-dependent oxidoreductase [Thermoanaerobaculia bacterium]